MLPYTTRIPHVVKCVFPWKTERPPSTQHSGQACPPILNPHGGTLWGKRGFTNSDGEVASLCLCSGIQTNSREHGKDIQRPFDWLPNKEVIFCPSLNE